MPLSARELKVESFRLLPHDYTAKINLVKDYNDDICALIKVTFPLEGCIFEGVFGEVSRHGDEYMVYLPEGSKRFSIKYPGYETLIVEFSKISDIASVKGGKTYNMQIQPQKILLYTQWNGYND